MEKILSPDEAALLDALRHPHVRDLAREIEQRPVFYSYPQAQEILTKFLYPVFDRAGHTGNHRGLIYFLYGGYHTGKSHLLRYFASLMERFHPEYWDIAEAPILKVDLTNHVNTAQQLLQFLLEKLGRPVDPKLLASWKKTNCDHVRLQERLVRLLEDLGTRVLILDECQKLLVSRNPDITDIFELLKDLSTKHNWHGDLQTRIVLCGTQDGVPLLEAADWIQGRTMTVKLQPLQAGDFATFLLSIYRDFFEAGVTGDWDLVRATPGSSKRRLDQAVAQYLFSRTGGKAGLTVDLIRNATLLALDQGRLAPTRADFEAIRLTEKSFVFTNPALETSPTPARGKRSTAKVRIGLGDRTCCVHGCSRAEHPYKRYSALVQHYKLKHPGVELAYEDD